MRIEACRLCPRSCGARREEASGAGFCGMGADPVVARAALHFWEEPCISGTKGSGTVFFTGCPLKCVYCQNYAISTEHAAGRRVTAEQLSEIFQNLIAQGAHNINLVNPTHFAPAIVRALRLRPLSVPVVYNSSGYEKVETLRLFEGLVDIYLPDFKYMDSGTAQKYSAAPDYAEHAKAAVMEMARQTGGARFDESGLMTRGTVVRHLVLPSNTKNSLAVLAWLKENLPQGALVSLMAQYVPCGRAADFPEIDRPVTRREFGKVQRFLFDLGLDGFVQEMSSAKKSFIPPFDLTGVPTS